MSGGGSQKAPTPYQPPNQGAAAKGFQQGAGQLASAGQQLYGSVAPQLSQIVSNVSNNPYYTQAMQGAQQAAGMATGQVAPMQFAGANQDTSIANLAALAGPMYANAAGQGGVTGFNEAQSMLPGTTGGSQYAPGVLGALAGMGGTTAGLDLQALQNLGTTGLQAANSILNTGFDPQNALYNQQYQQQQDQQNAVAAQSGLAGSPYAAGIANTADQNFNINWQNAQLARQIQALGAYNTAASTYAGDTSQLTSGAINNFATGLNSGVNDYNSLTSTAANNAASLIGAGSNALNSGINTGVGALSTLGNLGISANDAASNLGTAGLNTLAGAAQLPQDIYLQQQQAELAALGAKIQGTNASLAGTQLATGDYGTYLGIGQQASQGAIQAAQVNNQAAAQSAAGFGNLFGSIAGMFSFGLPV